MTGLEAAEKSVAEMIGKAYTGASTSPAADPEPPEVVKFDFDESFQTRLAALILRDDEFVRRNGHMVKPDYFESIGEATMVGLVLRHYQRYGSIPDFRVLGEVIKDEARTGILRNKEVLREVARVRKELYVEPLTAREYVEEKLVRFVRHQAIGEAILKSVDLREKGEHDKIEALFKAAVSVGANEAGDTYDYFASIKERTEVRLDKAAGIAPPTGITTGMLKLDDLLYHKGWGRKELSIIMGGAKAGKTTALIGFAKAASLKGFNVLYVTLEVSKQIISERLDASITDTAVRDLQHHIIDVRDKVEELAKRAGKLMLEEFPSGTLTPNTLRGILQKHRDKGNIFDMVVVDYADIMAPNYRAKDAIENSKSVYVDLRALATEFNVAMLTATQTNRDGFKAVVAKAEHVAEDFNKVRTADIIISINKTEEEASNGEARLYFAASRNQESGFTVYIKQDIARMQFITSIIKVE